MTRQPRCELIGKWRIVEADLWDEAYLDLVEPAHIIFRADGRGEIAFGVLTGTLDCAHGQRTIFFTWVGSDEGDEMSGSGSAELEDDGTLNIEFSFHNGEDAELNARRW